MGTFIVVLAVTVIVVGVLVTQALERRRAARVAAWAAEPLEEDEVIELDERDLWSALPPPPPARAFHHHVHHAV